MRDEQVEAPRNGEVSRRSPPAGRAHYDSRETGTGRYGQGCPRARVSSISRRSLKPAWGSRRLPLLGAAVAPFLTFFTQVTNVCAEPSAVVPEVGHNYLEHETPRMTALGGPTRANANSLTALYSNPANMSVAQLYHVGAMAQIYPEARRQSYGGAIVDSLISSTGLAGGLGGVWTMQDPDGIRRESMDVRFGLGVPLGDMFFLGLTGKYITLQQNGAGPLGFSHASGGLQDTNIIQTLTFDAGATLRPIPEFSIAITGHNLTNPETTLLPLMGGLGVGFGTGDFGISGDVVLEGRTYEQTNVRANAGGEVLLADRVALRGGYRFDKGLESHAVSGGLGYVDPRYSIDASLRRGVVGPGYFAVVFGFTIHIEAMGLGSSSPDAY